MNFCTFERLIFTKWTKFTAPKMAKTAVFALWESPKLISRKISVIQKYGDFHTVLKFPGKCFNLTIFKLSNSFVKLVTLVFGNRITRNMSRINFIQAAQARFHLFPNFCTCSAIWFFATYCSSHHSVIVNKILLLLQLFTVWLGLDGVDTITIKTEQTHIKYSLRVNLKLKLKFPL